MCFLHFAREAAGATGTRHSPAPSDFHGAERSRQNSRAGGEIAKVCVQHFGAGAFILRDASLRDAPQDEVSDPHGDQPLDLGGVGRPWSTAGDDGIEEDEKLSGAGDEGLLVGFSFCDQSSIERDELGIPLKCGGQGRGIQTGT